MNVNHSVSPYGSVTLAAVYLYIYLVGELLMGSQDVAFLSSDPSYCTTFLKNCGRGENLTTTTTTCPMTVVGGKQGQAPCEILFCIKAFFVSVKFHNMSVAKMG